MYVIETRTGSGVTRRVCQGEIPQPRISDSGISDNFYQNYLPLDMLPPAVGVASVHRKCEGPTDEELDAIERGEDTQDL